MHAMVEHACQGLLLVAKRVEMRRLPRRLQVAAVLVLAVDRFFRDERLEPIDGGVADAEELARARLAESRHESRRIQLQPGEHLPAVARARAPADVLALEDDDSCARASEMPGRCEARITRANDRHIDTLGRDLRLETCGLGLNRVPPVRLFLHRRAF